MMTRGRVEEVGRFGNDKTNAYEGKRSLETVYQLLNDNV